MASGSMGSEPSASFIQRKKRAKGSLASVKSAISRGCGLAWWNWSSIGLSLLFWVTGQFFLAAIPSRHGHLRFPHSDRARLASLIVGAGGGLSDSRVGVLGTIGYAYVPLERSY